MLDEQRRRILQTEAAGRTPSVNSNDDVLSALEWIMEECSVNMHAFAKRLPHTSDDLQQGRVTPLQVADEIMSILRRLDIQYAREETPGNESLDFTNKLIYEAAKDTCLLLIPRHWTRYCEEDSRLYQEIMENFHTLLVQSLEKNRAVVKSTDFESQLMHVSYEIVQGQRKIWAPRLDDHFFKGKQGTFITKSPLGNATLEEFIKMIDTLRDVEEFSQEEHNKQILQSLHVELTVTAKYVKQGVHKTMETCWECGADSAPYQDLQKCGNCQVALYCSRDCQRKAWKCGHKEKCIELLKRHKKLEEQFKIVDEAHVTGFLNGVRLQCDLDYQVAQLTIFAESVLPDDELSMHAYYENLSRVIKGDWWVNANKGRLDDLFEKAKLAANENWSISDCQLLGVLLCSDYFKFASLSGKKRPDDVLDLCHDAVCEVMEHLGLDLNIPAEWFLIMYESREYAPYINRMSVRREKKDVAYHRLKKTFHK